MKAKAGIPIGLLALAVGCAGGETGEASSTLPEQIHGLTRVEVQTGERAAEVIGNLHSTSVAPTNSEVALYGPENMRAALYVSEFESAAVAQEQLTAMSDGIGQGTAGFGHHTTFEVEGREIHSVFGQGQIHYFYADGADLVWISLPPAIARPGLAEVLNVELSSVPDLGG